MDEYSWLDHQETIELDERIKIGEVSRSNREGVVIANGEIFLELTEALMGLQMTELTSWIRADGETELLYQSELFLESENRPSRAFMRSEISEDNLKSCGQGAFEFNEPHKGV